jgi:lysozyme
VKLSREGFDFLAGHEGIRYQVYDDHYGTIISSYSDSEGRPTIGIGHLINPDEYERFRQYLGGGKSMTHSQVYELFLDDVPRYYKFMNKITKPITQSMFDSMTSLSFNTGNNSSTVKNAIRLINEGDYQGAATAIYNGIVHSSGGKLMEGLVRRRKEEAELFLKDGIGGAKIGGLIVFGIVSFGLIKFLKGIKNGK